MSLRLATATSAAVAYGRFRSGILSCLYASLLKVVLTNSYFRQRAVEKLFSCVVAGVLVVAAYRGANQEPKSLRSCGSQYAAIQLRGVYTAVLSSIYGFGERFCCIRSIGRPRVFDLSVWLSWKDVA